MIDILEKNFLYSNLACSIIIGSAAFYGITNEHTPWILALAVFGTTMFHYSIHYPNLYAFGQEITEKENYGKLNSYIEIQGQSTSIFAGAFAAILLFRNRKPSDEFDGHQYSSSF